MLQIINLDVSVRFHLALISEDVLAYTNTKIA